MFYLLLEELMADDLEPMVAHRNPKQHSSTCTLAGSCPPTSTPVPPAPLSFPSPHLLTRPADSSGSAKTASARLSADPPRLPAWPARRPAPVAPILQVINFWRTGHAEEARGRAAAPHVRLRVGPHPAHVRLGHHGRARGAAVPARRDRALAETIPDHALRTLGKHDALDGDHSAGFASQAQGGGRRRSSTCF